MNWNPQSGFEPEWRAQERRAAVAALLALPDPPELFGKRRYKYRCGGDKLRQPLLKVEFEQAWLRHRAVGLGRAEDGIVCVRRGV